MWACPCVAWSTGRAYSLMNYRLSFNERSGSPDKNRLVTSQKVTDCGVTCWAAACPSGINALWFEEQSPFSYARSSPGREKCPEKNILIIFHLFAPPRKVPGEAVSAFFARRYAAFSGVTNFRIGCASWVPAGSAPHPSSPAAESSPALKMRPRLEVRKRPVREKRGDQWDSVSHSEPDMVSVCINTCESHMMTGTSLTNSNSVSIRGILNKWGIILKYCTADWISLTAVVTSYTANHQLIGSQSTKK